MSKKWPGGIITPIPATPTGPYQTGAAPGIWTLSQQAYWAKQGLWPTAGILGPSSFIGLLYGSNADQAYAIKGDSAGNIYVVGTSDVSGVSYVQIAKYSFAGVLLWQTRIGDGSSYAEALSVTFDSSNNVYVCGRGTGSVTSITIKLNSSGVIQWQRQLNSGSSNTFGTGIAIDSSSNLFVSGYVGNDIILYKYDSSGTLQWQRNINGGNDIGRSVSVDTSGNVYVGGYTNSSPSSTTSFFLAKYNTSGTLQWQRVLYGSGVGSPAFGVATDSSANVYIVGYSSIQGDVDYHLAKYDSSGTLQWKNYLGGSGEDEAYSVAVDSSDNVYICGNSTSGATKRFVFAKYNSSGTIQWQRYLGTTQSIDAKSISIDSLGAVCIAGYISISGRSDDFIFARLPADGSLTGTYTLGGLSYTYAASSLTSGTSSLTSATSSLTSSTPSYTDSALSFTATTSTLTSAVTTL